MNKLAAKPVSWGSVVVIGLQGAFVFSPQMRERWIHPPSSVSVFQEHTEHLAQFWFRLFSVLSQNPPLSILWRVMVDHCTKLTFYLAICMNVTATDKTLQMSEGEECKWGIHRLVWATKREQQPNCDITVRRDGLSCFSEKRKLLFFTE